MQEQEFFSSENVYVSLTRFVAFGQTYAMSGVTSVKATEVHPGRLLPILMGGIGILCFMGDGGAMVLGTLLVLLAAALWLLQKPEYFVTLSVSSGEVRALKSDDREFISKVIQALNDSIVARG
jgi:hypothetical protein